jgi:flagellar basal-body rod modification protein FlgD
MDGSGKVVHSINLGKQDAGVQALAWDGTTDSGAAAADGNYTFKVTATSAGQSVDATALSYGQVGSITTNSSGVKVNVGGLGAVDLSDIRQII